MKGKTPEDILKSAGYIVNLEVCTIDNQKGLKATFPPNNIVFPSMNKIISYYFPTEEGISYSTGSIDSPVNIEIPQYLIRPTIQLDVNIMCDSIGYDKKYIQGNVHDIIHLDLDGKSAVLEDYAYELMKLNDGHLFPLSLGYFLRNRYEEIRSSLV